MKNKNEILINAKDYCDDIKSAIDLLIKTVEETFTEDELKDFNVSFSASKDSVYIDIKNVLSSRSSLNYYEKRYHFKDFIENKSKAVSELLSEVMEKSAGEFVPVIFNIAEKKSTMRDRYATVELEKRFQENKLNLSYILNPSVVKCFHNNGFFNNYMVDYIKDPLEKVNFVENVLVLLGNRDSLTEVKYKNLKVKGNINYYNNSTTIKEVVNKSGNMAEVFNSLLSLKEIAGCRNLNTYELVLSNLLSSNKSKSAVIDKFIVENFDYSMFSSENLKTLKNDSLKKVEVPIFKEKDMELLFLEINKKVLSGFKVFRHVQGGTYVEDLFPEKETTNLVKGIIKGITENVSDERLELKTFGISKILSKDYLIIDKTETFDFDYFNQVFGECFTFAKKDLYENKIVGFLEYNKQPSFKEFLNKIEAKNLILEKVNSSTTANAMDDEPSGFAPFKI